jgi:hypothetical protein
MDEKERERKINIEREVDEKERRKKNCCSSSMLPGSSPKPKKTKQLALFSGENC